MQERRQSVRVECEIPSSVRDLDSQSPNHIRDAVIRNLSRGGMRLRMNEFIPIQDHLTVYFNLPNHHSVEVRITLAWVIELPQIGKYEMGARFAELSREDEDAIQSFQYRAILDRISSKPYIVKDPNHDHPETRGRDAA